tara:strand:- start:360 stop:2084 length:1725 start_codon:yes stop_codon:yes gene_type:complete
MLNVKTLTDTMSRMQLPQLQQYATLHKNDPYIVTLALSIANQKKQMKAGQEGQAGMQPQPKVADQQIAQMVAPPPQQMAAAPQQGLPENSGIGQLPAQNMQGMAEGGIVAFDDGGSVPGYADGVYVGQGFNQTPLVPPPANRNALIANKAAELAEQSRQEELRKIQEALQTMPSGQQKAYLENRQKILLGKQAPTVDPSTTLPAGTTFTPPGMPAAMTGSNAAPVDVNKVLADKTTTDKTRPLVEKSGILNLPTNTPTASALNTTSLTPEQAMTAGQKFGDESTLNSGIDKLRTDALATNAAIQAANTEGLAKLAKPGTEAEARLKAREAQDVVGQADAKAMAIFKAGLGMMAGTSQHAFENIGKGAMAGLEDYSASIKDFRKLGIERDKAYAEIEAARNAAARDDFKTSLGLQEKGADRLARAHEKGVDLTASLFKTNKETASTIYRSSFEQTQQNQRTQLEQTEQTKRTASTNAAHLQGLASTNATHLSAIDKQMEMYKGPMHVEQVRKDVAAELAKNINFKTASPEEQAGMVEKAMQTRAQTDPLLRQFMGTTGGGSAPGLRFNLQTGKIE